MNLLSPDAVERALPVGMDLEEYERALENAGVAKHLARELRRRAEEDRAIHQSARHSVPTTRTRAPSRALASEHDEQVASGVLPAIQWPVKLTLPWSYLVSDNRRHGVINGKLLLTADYRRCKGLVRDLARCRLGAVELATYPVAVEARVWVPDDIRAHDVANFQKCVLDALETVVYTKDHWVHSSQFVRVGVDVDAPRAELTIRRVL